MIRRRGRQHGGNFWKKLKQFAIKANRWLRKTKAISKSAKLANDFGVPYADKIGKVAKMTGYGRRKVRRRRRGGNLGGNFGGSLKLAGSGRRRVKKKMRTPPPMTY